MKASTFLIVSLCAVLCSCERSQKVKLGVGRDPTWISDEEARQVGERLMTNRYPQAQIVSEHGSGQICTYWFATNGTALPEGVVVDLKIGKARFKTYDRQNHSR